MGFVTKSITTLEFDSHISFLSPRSHAISNTMFGWDDLGRKEREGKEIGRKGVYFFYLVEGKSWEGKGEQCPKFCGPRMNSGNFFSLHYWVENWGKGVGFLFFPFLPSSLPHKQTVSPTQTSHFPCTLLWSPP